MSKRQKHSQKGFTIIELMIVLGVAAALLVVAIPSFDSMIKRNRISAEVNRLVANLNYARSEAVAQGQTITLAHKSAANNDWSQGLRSYVDVTPAVGGSAYDAANDTLLKDVGASPGRLTVNSNAQGSPFISFRPNGMLNEGGAGVVIAVCDEDGTEQGRAITINLVGRISVADTATCSP
jgi:type IV fimbrial biogenesis protein FimT